MVAKACHSFGEQLAMARHLVGEVDALEVSIVVGGWSVRSLADWVWGRRNGCSGREEIDGVCERWPVAKFRQ